MAVKTNLGSPLLWQSLPTKDDDAWLSWLGDHLAWHRLLAELTGAAYLDFGDLKHGGLDSHQRVHDELADSLDIPRPGDLASFDLQKPDSLTNFMFVHSLEHQRLRLVLEI